MNLDDLKADILSAVSFHQGGSDLAEAIADCSDNHCERDQDWEDIGMGRKQCTYLECQKIEDF